MNGGGVKRVDTIPDAHETCALFVGFWTQARDIPQLLSRLKRTVGIAIRHDVGSQLRADACHVGEQGRAGGVEVHADRIDHTLDHAVERMAEGGLVYVMLVEADANGLGIDLDQFGQRVLRAARNRDRPTDGDVQVRKLGARQG